MAPWPVRAILSTQQILCLLKVPLPLRYFDRVCWKMWDNLQVDLVASRLLLGPFNNSRVAPDRQADDQALFETEPFPTSTVVHRALNSGAGDEKGRYICSRGTYPILALYIDTCLGRWCRLCLKSLRRMFHHLIWWVHIFTESPSIWGEGENRAAAFSCYRQHLLLQTAQIYVPTTILQADVCFGML